MPGRLCLLGEHSDWAGGYRSRHPHIPAGRCLATGTDQGLRGTAERSDGLELRTVLPSGNTLGPERIDLGELDAFSRRPSFFSYAAGVAAELADRGAARGLRVEVTAADLPIAKGLSSSAAICVLVARAYSHVYDLGLSVRDEMELFNLSWVEPAQLTLEEFLNPWLPAPIKFKPFLLSRTDQGDGGGGGNDEHEEGGDLQNGP